MQLFYHPGIDPESRMAFFSKEESRHIIRVLRKNTGDSISLTDGRGYLYEAEIIEASEKKCQVRILSSTSRGQERNYRLHVAMAPTKMNDRFEWFLEKSTEIGIDEITPILCDHSERHRVKPERFEKVIQSAMKQSLKYTLPLLNPVAKVEDLIRSARSEAKLIAHCYEGVKGDLTGLIQGKSDILVLIGPEGDFSQEEVEIAQKSGFKGLDLGKSRLRTETAGVVVCSNISLIKEFL